jgi:hypothetical protein
MSSLVPRPRCLLLHRQSRPRCLLLHGQPPPRCLLLHGQPRASNTVLLTTRVVSCLDHGASYCTGSLLPRPPCLDHGASYYTGSLLPRPRCLLLHGQPPASTTVPLTTRVVSCLDHGASYCTGSLLPRPRCLLLHGQPRASTTVQSRQVTLHKYINDIGLEHS